MLACLAGNSTQAEHADLFADDDRLTVWLGNTLLFGVEDVGDDDSFRSQIGLYTVRADNASFPNETASVAVDLWMDMPFPASFLPQPDSGVGRWWSNTTRPRRSPTRTWRPGGNPTNAS